MNSNGLIAVYVWALLGSGITIFPLAPVDAQTTNETLSNFEVDEQFDPVWPVAGEVVIGVMAGWRESPDGKPLLIVLSGQRMKPAPFCIDMVSRSGEYKAQAKIKLESHNTDSLQLDWIEASEKPTRVKSLDPVDVAIRATYGNCDDVDAPFLLATWRSAVESAPESIIVLLNAKTSAAELSLSANGRSIGNTKCTKVADPRRRGYDFVCKLPLTGPLPNVDRLEGVVLRKQFGSAKRPGRFTISLRDPG